jgi:formylglycine-generating enzyme required for sulfatase activity
MVRPKTMEFIKIPGKQFEMQVTQVTQFQWKEIMGENPSNFKGVNLPVEQVSWNDCLEFIKKLNDLDDGYFYRLPKELEWEYCAKSCDSQNLDQIAWYAKNSSAKTQDVAMKAPNELGLYDMLGNVWEWCEDLYSKEGSYRVFRGGGWAFDAQYLRSAYRCGSGPAGRGTGVGFRLVRIKL